MGKGKGEGEQGWGSRRPALIPHPLGGEETVPVGAAAPAPPAAGWPGTTRACGLGGACERRFISGWPGRFLPLTAEGRGQGCRLISGPKALLCSAVAAAQPWKGFFAKTSFQTRALPVIYKHGCGRLGSFT